MVSPICMRIFIYIYIYLCTVVPITIHIRNINKIIIFGEVK